ncbi:hypothetical protein SK128_018632 [Halocaridina rubra]|uniref:Uncharacterized protein n=1 Tax=Halocaridina rubra TaxID=373956 RepID=A0AAN8XWG6_HALRR
MSRSHRGSNGSVRDSEASGRGFAPRHGLRLARACTQGNDYICRNKGIAESRQKYPDSLGREYTEEAIPSPLAPPHLVDSYDTQGKTEEQLSILLFILQIRN